MKNKIFFIILSLCTALVTRSQVSITGPACVVPGIQYQYLISTTDTTGKGVHICLTGGSYSTGDSCLNDSLVSAIYITWHTGTTNLAVSYSSDAGSNLLNVQLTTALQAGAIDAAYTEQSIDYNTAITSITCPAATGGTCSPAYSYQWQRSVDNVNWENISGATNQNMDVSLTLTQTTYLRRKVTETVSSSVGYSTVAAVYVAAAPAGTASTRNITPAAAPGNTKTYISNIAFGKPGLSRLTVVKQYPSTLNSL